MAGNAFELNCTTGREMRKTLVYLPLNTAERVVEQCSEAEVEPEAAMGLADEVENRQTLFSVEQPQTAAE